jgi:hypothetical protein
MRECREQVQYVRRRFGSYAVSKARFSLYLAGNLYLLANTGTRSCSEQGHLLALAVDQNPWQYKGCVAGDGRVHELERDGFNRHDQYTTIVQSKTAQTVPNHPKSIGV